MFHRNYTIEVKAAQGLRKRNCAHVVSGLSAVPPRPANRHIRKLPLSGLGSGPAEYPGIFRPAYVCCGGTLALTPRGQRHITLAVRLHFGLGSAGARDVPFADHMTGRPAGIAHANPVTGTDTDDFEREYARLPSGISGLAAVTERHCLSPQGEFKREWRRISARRFPGNAARLPSETSVSDWPGKWLRGPHNSVHEKFRNCFLLIH